MTDTEEDFIKEVKKGLQEGSTIDSYDGFMRNTVLMCAAYMGYKKAVVLFIELGADVNAENNASNTSITFACHQGHADIVKILLEEGARISCKRNQDAQGNGTIVASPLMVGVEHGHLEVVKVLLNARQGRVLDDCIDTALAIAEAKGFKEIEQLLVEAGAKKDKLYKKQVKAFHKMMRDERKQKNKEMVETNYCEVPIMLKEECDLAFDIMEAMYSYRNPKYSFDDVRRIIESISEKHRSDKFYIYLARLMDECRE